MGAVPSEILIRTFFEASLADLRENNWILEDVFSALATDPISRITHGWKEVEEAVSWVKNNDIQIYEQFRIGDTPTLPCITIEKVASGEHLARTNLGDQGFITKQPPEDLRKQIRKVYENFSPKGYDYLTGTFILPSNLFTTNMAVGMFVVARRTGKAYEIKKILGSTSFSITPGIMNEDFSEVFIAPSSQLYNVHRELTYLNERFVIGIHTASRLVTNLWLSQVVQYIMVRYKEAYLEARGFELSTFQMGPVELNQEFSPEVVFSRTCSMTGDIPFDFIKFAAPQLDKVNGGIVIIDGPKTPDGFRVPVTKEGWFMEGDLPIDLDEDNIPTLGKPDGNEE